MSWEESKHPRDDDGKFTKKYGGTPAEQEALKKYTQKRFGKSGISFDENGDYIIDYNIWDNERKKREDYFKTSLDAFEESFDTEQQLNWARLSLNDYSSTMYDQINPYLYENKSGDARLDKRIKILDDVISRYEMPDDMKVFRCIDSGSLKNLGITDINNAIGKIITNKAYSSCSLDKDIMQGFVNSNQHTTGNKQVIMEIDIPKGKNIGFPVFYNSAFKEEQEILLKRNSKIKVLDVYDENGVWIIKGNMLQ